MNSLRTKGNPRGAKRSRRWRERFPFLVLLSCLIHATLVLLLVLALAREHRSEAPEAEQHPPEVTLEIPPPEKSRPFLEAKQAAEKPPENAPFESDENTKAASELPPDGTAPMPSQQGITQSAIELQNQKYTPGEKPASQAGNPAKPPAQTAPQQPPAPDSTPQASPTPQSTPSPQPTPSIPPPPNSVRLLEPQQSKPKTAPAKAQHAPPSPAQPPSQPGAPGAKKGYQPETHQTVIHGNISNRGRASVAGEATPIGRYKKGLADAIGSRWYYYVNERMGLLSIGTVNVAFRVTAEGKVSGLHVVSSNSNESLTDCSLRSIMDAKFPPIPPEVARTLQNGSLEIEYSFTIY